MFLFDFCELLDDPSNVERSHIKTCDDTIKNLS